MHELEFTDNEILIVLNALDFYSRIWIGQYDHMLWDLRWYRNCSQLDALDDTLRRKFWDIRNIILPGLRKYSLNGSYGIFSRLFRNYPLLLLYPMYLNFASSNCLPHLPYIVRFIIFNLLLVPSTNPLL